MSLWRDIKFNIKMKYQKLTRGYSDLEVWNLNDTFCIWILPRLKYFRKHTIAYPPDLTPEKWDEILDKMILAFELYLDDSDDNYEIDKNGKYTIPDLEKMKLEGEKIWEGFRLFGQYLRYLWW